MNVCLPRQVNVLLFFLPFSYGLVKGLYSIELNLKQLEVSKEVYGAEQGM